MIKKKKIDALQNLWSEIYMQTGLFFLGLQWGAYILP